MNVLGIDIGGSGIKGAVVDATTGRLVTPRLRVETPLPPHPAAVARSTAALVRRFGWRGPIGIGFPGIVRGQVAFSAANLVPRWIGLNLAQFFGKATACPVHAINDGDAAGMAEMRFGAGSRERGAVLVLTLGTGIGSALFHNGVLFPNLEFGHLKFKDTIAEKYGGAATRKRLDLTWPQWAKRLNEILHHMHFLVSADLIILGGGVSAKYDRFARYLNVPTRIAPARLKNNAGIIGAAIAAAEGLPKTKLTVKSFVPPLAAGDE